MDAVETLFTLTAQMPATTANDVAKEFHNNKLGMLWLAVEEPTRFWTDSQPGNRDAFTSLLKAFKDTGLEPGISTTRSWWSQIFGDDFTAASDLPLLYGNDDGIQSFDDFTAFGGWTRPSRKAYNKQGALFGNGIESYIWCPDDQPADAAADGGR